MNAKPPIGFWRRDITRQAAPQFSPLPKGKLTREQVQNALAERVAAGTLTAADAVYLLGEFDAVNTGGTAQ